MTDNRTTELLREGLTERGIEWRSGLEGVTFVGDWCFVEYDNGKLAATCEPVLTPEQVIAATLGGGTCELVETDSYSNANETIHVLECSECGKTCEHVNGSYPRCPHCGARVVSANES